MDFDQDPSRISDEQNASAPPSAWPARLLILGLVALVFAPVLFYGCHSELNRWRAATLMERYLDGEQQTAIGQLEKIVEQQQDPYLIGVLAEWYLKADAAQQALETLQQIPPPRRDGNYQTLYTNCLLALDRADEALEEYKQANRTIRNSTFEATISHLNSLAYFRALAAKELDLAAKDIGFVVDELEQQWNSIQPIKMDIHQQASLSAAVIYLAMAKKALAANDENPASQLTPLNWALDILDPAIEDATARYASRLGRNKREIALLLKDDLPLSQRSEQKLLGLRGKLQSTAKQLSYFLAIRSLADQMAGNRRASYRDRLLVEQLGFDAQRLVDQLPGEQICSSHLTVLATFLDTRGCVAHARGFWKRGLKDLDSAVAAQQTLLRLGRDSSLASFEVATDARLLRERFEESPRRTLAVLLFHRSWVFQSLDQPHRAQQDLAQIRELGFAPGSHLF